MVLVRRQGIGGLCSGTPCGVASLAASPSLCEGDGWLFAVVHEHPGGDFGFLVFFVLIFFIGLAGWAVVAEVAGVVGAVGCYLLVVG